MLSIVVAAVALTLVAGTFVYLISDWGESAVAQVPETVKTELSETDKKKVDETKELLHETFGEDVVDTIAKASNKQRVDLMDEFAHELAKLYGLDIDIDITIDKVSSWGYYSYDNKKAVFNIAVLMADAENSAFKTVVLEVIDTIIHELRHAVQHKAASDPDFWDVGEERAKTWAANMRNYVRPGVDPRGYANQPVEADATTFAGAVMSEVR